MSKTTQTEAVKASKKYAKTRGEHYKDIVIAVMVAGVVAFVGGVTFANKQQAQVNRAVEAAKSVAPVASAEAPGK